MNSTAVHQAKKLIEEIWRDSKLWNRNLDIARELLETELKSDPNNIVLLTCLGAVLSDSGRHQEAIPILRHAIALGSNDSNTFFNLAVAMLNSEEDRTQAEAFFKKASIHPASMETWQAYFDPQGH